jgi:hypothetical protein
MKDILLRAPQAVQAAVGRCDRAAMRTWMKNHYAECTGENWGDSTAGGKQLARFVETRSLTGCDFHLHHANCYLDRAGVWASNERALNLMRVLYSSGLTVCKLQMDGLRLTSFSGTTHFAEPLMRTYP